MGFALRLQIRPDAREFGPSRLSRSSRLHSRRSASKASSPTSSRLMPESSADLSSQFIPTCAQCTTPVSAPGLVAYRSQSTMAICRDCHQRMSFKFPDVKFLRVSAAGTGRARAPLPRKRPKENLGIVSGQELPRRGRCRHYAKSYRWFRFSCCLKVYPCDRCHDAAEEHPNEHANRMICGHCSREQIYRPEDCVHCRSSLIRKRGGGFWEGGKGTRDKTKMNRKDPRKYKRRGAATTGSGK
jgi:uncharacterized CHY-type Zn-finger protein